jgi:hypothetical protein
MNVATGAWLAAITGCTTGAAYATLGRRTPPSRKWVIAHVLLGALIGAVCYAGFLLAGYAVSFLTFSGPPDPGPALLCVFLGCAAFLLLRWLHSMLASHFGLPERSAPGGRRNLRDLLDARPRRGRVTRWLGGVGVALLPVLYGLRCILAQAGELGTLIWPSRVEGGAAIALGLGWIGVGLFLHFHFFFGLHSGLSANSRMGKSIALIVACVGLTVAGAWSLIEKVPR